jgi:hypothetical protein
MNISIMFVLFLIITTEITHLRLCFPLDYRKKKKREDDTCLSMFSSFSVIFILFFLAREWWCIRRDIGRKKMNEEEKGEKTSPVDNNSRTEKLISWTNWIYYFKITLKKETNVFFWNLEFKDLSILSILNFKKVPLNNE